MYNDSVLYLFFFFFQAEDGIRDVAVTGVQTCALPISQPRRAPADRLRLHRPPGGCGPAARDRMRGQDRKSTRLNSSHGYISYAVFCLKKKKNSIALPAYCRFSIRCSSAARRLFSPLGP